MQAGRIHVYECWDSAADLEAFRGCGQSDEQIAQILGAYVRRYLICAETVA